MTRKQRKKATREANKKSNNMASEPNGQAQKGMIGGETKKTVPQRMADLEERLHRIELVLTHPGQQDVTADPGQYQPRQENERAEPITPLPTNVTPPPNNRERSDNKWHKTTYRRVARFGFKALEGVGIIAVVAYTLLTYEQWQDLRRNFILDQRPYIWLKNDLEQPTYVEASGQFVWSWHMTNYGKTPAHRVRYYEYAMIGNTAAPSHRAVNAPEGPGIAPPLPPGKDDFSTIISRPGITSMDYNTLLRTGGVGLMVRITYEDAYGRPYETGFCFHRLATGAVAYCRDGNYMK